MGAAGAANLVCAGPDKEFCKMLTYRIALVWLCLIVAGSGGEVLAQAVSGVGGGRPALSQSLIIVPAGGTDRQCTSISSKSRRCHFTFAVECKKRGQSKQHCTQMDGFCHACTDQYALCKGDAAKAGEKGGKPAECGSCNGAYDRCITSMVKQYGGKLVTVP